MSVGRTPFLEGKTETGRCCKESGVFSGMISNCSFGMSGFS